MTALDALQTALEAEHATIYVYGVLGAQTSRTAQPTLFAALDAAYAAHRDRREVLVALVTRAGGTPVPAAAAYSLPGDVTTPAGVSAAALGLERGCAATYAFVVASTQDEQRGWAVQALADAAVRELAFGGAPEDLPGAS